LELGPLGEGTERRDGNRRCVRREDHARARDGVELGEDRLLDVEVLDDGLDYVVAVGEVVNRRGGRQARLDLGLRLGCELALFHELAEALVDCLQRAVDRGRRGVVQLHREARLREDLRDAVAHRAGADDPNRLDVHN